MDSSFDSVDAFLKAAQAHKSTQREAIEKELAPMLQSPSTYAVPPALSKEIAKLVEKYGDEAWKQTAMFCIGYWASFHEDSISQARDPNAAIWAMSDLSTLRHCLRMIDDVSAFRGADEWKEMLQEEVGQAVLEACEEQNITPEQWFDRMSND